MGAGYDGFEDLWGALETGAGPASAYAARLVRIGAARSVRSCAAVWRPGRAVPVDARAWVATGVRHRIQPTR